MKIVHIEDTDEYAKQVEETLLDNGITKDCILRATNFIEARRLIKKMQDDVIWIVDGVFPARSGERPEKFGPDAINAIRFYRGNREKIYWLSSRPDIFQNVREKVTLVLDKEFMVASLLEIVDGITEVSENPSESLQ